MDSDSNGIYRYTSNGEFNVQAAVTRIIRPKLICSIGLFSDKFRKDAIALPELTCGQDVNDRTAELDRNKSSSGATDPVAISLRT